MLKNGRDLLDHGTLKSTVSHKWFDELIFACWEWLNNFWFDHQSALYSVSLTFVGCPLLVKNDVLHLLPSGIFSELGFPKCF